MRHGWGGRSAAFRQIFTSTFFPDASPQLAEWWNELQRQTTTPENAAAILSALGDVDVRATTSHAKHGHFVGLLAAMCTPAQLERIQTALRPLLG
jgi:hypothetical protein